MNEQDRAYDALVNGRALSWLMENCAPCDDADCEECKTVKEEKEEE